MFAQQVKELLLQYAFDVIEPDSKGKSASCLRCSFQLLCSRTEYKLTVVANDRVRIAVLGRGLICALYSASRRKTI